MSTRTVLYLVTEDWYFWSHRLPLARAARDKGYGVVVGTRTNAHADRIAAEGFRLAEIPFERSLKYPQRDLAALVAIIRCLWRERPALVHLVSLKPILLGGLAATFAPRTTFVNAATGLGYVFSSSDRSAGLIQRVVVAVLRLLLNRDRNWLVLQNRDDVGLLRQRRIGRAERTVVIRGSGVDLKAFAACPIDFASAPVVVLPARMLRDKGIGEFVEAAHMLKRALPDARMALVGPGDPDNPAGVTESRIQSWVAEGAIEWWGPRDDMANVYRAARIVCLPSYREGLPKVLLEGAACARPLVATDVPGCREVCRDGETGLLVPPRDPAALAAALAKLIADPEQCRRLGANARALVEREFSTATICAQTIDLYDRIARAQ